MAEAAVVRYRGTLMLVILTMLLGGFYFFYQRPRVAAQNTAAEFEKRFFRADAAAISAIIIENRDGVVEISHGVDGWMIERPQRYRPDDGMVRKLLDTIATGQLTKVVGDATELQQFGFDRPVLQLTLRVGQKSDVLLIGQQNPTDTGYYAYSESLGKIFLISKELPKELYLRLFDLREKRLYPAIATEMVGRVIITHKKTLLDAAVDGNVWRMREPFAAVASPEEMKLFLNGVVAQKAVAFLPWDKSLAKLPQQRRLQLFDIHGKALVDSMVYYVGTGENEGVVVHEEGSAEAARTPREFWENFQVAPADLMERRLFPAIPDQIQRISVTAGSDRTVLERQGNRWLKNGTHIESDDMPALLDGVRNWKAAKNAAKQQPGKPRTVIEVVHLSGVDRLTVSETTAGKSLSAGLPAMDINSEDVSYLLATSSALNRNILVGSHELTRFLKQLERIK